MTIDKNIMKECLAMLMVGGVEHTHMFSELNAWAIRNESRLWTAEKNNPETEQMLEPERQRWDKLIEIFSSIAQENQESS